MFWKFFLELIQHSKFYQILPILPYNLHINRDISTFMDRLSLITKICNFMSLWLVVWLHIFFIYILPQYPPPYLRYRLFWSWLPWISSQFYHDPLECSIFFCINLLKFWHFLEIQLLLLYPLEFSIDILTTGGL